MEAPGSPIVLHARLVHAVQGKDVFKTRRSRHKAQPKGQLLIEMQSQGVGGLLDAGKLQGQDLNCASCYWACVIF